jgi:hypothetical protein
MRPNDPNIEILQIAVEGLGPIADEVVFLGGCATGLLITDPAAPPIRETNDVDVIVEVASRHDYHRLADRLRQRGFREDSRAGAPICRWLYRRVAVDVMPTESAILGFSNRWYEGAMRCAIPTRLPGGTEIRLVTAPYFLATKLEAFYGRGKGDCIASHDLEDLIAVIDGRDAIAAEVHASPAPLRRYLSEAFSRLLANDAFRDALPGHMPGDAASQARISTILGRMERISHVNSQPGELSR